MRYVSLAVVLGLLVTAAARNGDAAPAPQTYTIKIKENPEKGETFVAREVEKSSMHLKITSSDDKVLKDEKAESVKEEVYTATTLEKGAVRAKKYKREYKKAELVKGKETKKHSYAGRTVVFEEKDGKFQATAEGTPELDAADLKMLVQKANNDKGEEGFKPLLPGKPVTVGETWEIAGKALAKSGMDFIIPQKSKGVGKLVKVYTKNGKQWGVLEVKVDAALKEEKGVSFDGPGKLTLTLDTAIDGSSMLGKLEMHMHFKIKQDVDQNGMKFKISNETDLKSTTNRTVKE